jgi:hypothetical protein
MGLRPAIKDGIDMYRIERFFPLFSIQPEAYKGIQTIRYSNPGNNTGEWL